MGKRSKTAGGEYDSGNGNFHGFKHRIHGHDSRPPWKERHTATAARRQRQDYDDLRGLARIFPFFAGGNRKRGERRNP